MPRSIAAILLSSAIAGCGGFADPPSATVTKVPVAVPCQVPEPHCPARAFNGAEKPMDVGEKTVRGVAELRQQEECLNLYRDALAACRQALPAPPK